MMVIWPWAWRFQEHIRTVLFSSYTQGKLSPLEKFEENYRTYALRPAPNY